MKDGSVAVKIDFPESDFAGATIYLEDWQAERLKARVDANNRCLRSLGRPEDYTMAHAIHFALEMYFRWLEEDPWKRQLPGDPELKITFHSYYERDLEECQDGKSNDRV